jgi:hypothetical protein
VGVWLPIDDPKDAEPAIQKCGHNEKIGANKPFSTDHDNKGYMVTWALENRLRELYVTMYECVKVAKAGEGCPAGCSKAGHQCWSCRRDGLNMQLKPYLGACLGHAENANAGMFVFLFSILKLILHPQTISCF